MAAPYSLTRPALLPGEFHSTRSGYQGRTFTMTERSTFAEQEASDERRF